MLFLEKMVTKIHYCEIVHEVVSEANFTLQSPQIYYTIVLYYIK